VDLHALTDSVLGVQDHIVEKHTVSAQAGADLAFPALSSGSDSALAKDVFDKLRVKVPSIKKVKTAKHPNMQTRDQKVQFMWEMFCARQFLLSCVQNIFSGAPGLTDEVNMQASKCLNDTCRALLVKLAAATSLASASVALLMPVFSFPSLAPGSVGTIVMFQFMKWKTTGKASELGSCPLTWPSHHRLSDTICEGGMFG
jgi:hypothetical protein